MRAISAAELRPRNMVADADGEALPRSGKYGERAIEYLQEFAGDFKKACAPRRKLHVAGRPLEEPAAEPLFKTLQLQAVGACVVRMASAARVKLLSSAMRRKAWTASKSRGRA